MRIFQTKKILIALVVFTIGLGALFLIYFQVAKIEAGVGDNVAGWAWSEIIGWLSFNCENTLAVCSSSDYGAHICEDDADANQYCARALAFGLSPLDDLLVGYVWSRGTYDSSGGIGWVSFNPDELVGCPAGYGPCEARFDTVSNEVSGWARACAVFADPDVCTGALHPERGGWDGWIKLRGTAQDATEYGVVIDDDVAMEFSGWAWAGDDITENSPVGWISFNAENPEIPDPVPPGPPYPDPPGPPYYVVPPDGTPPVIPNTPPTVTALSSLEWDYCAPAAQVFNWGFDDADGDGEEFYQIQTDRDGDWNTYTLPGEFDTGMTGPLISTIESKLVMLAANAVAGDEELAYNQTYTWRIKVWDERGAESAWDNGPANFSTPLHMYPSPDFDWHPLTPVQDELTQVCAVNDGSACLVNNSRCYDNSNSLKSCSGQSFVWTLDPDPAFVFELPSGFDTENPEVKSSARGLFSVNLDITDNSIPGGATCSYSDAIRVSFPLPDWREIAP